MVNRSKCVVPSCLYRHRKNDEERRSMFQCPKDEQKARRWVEQIPGLEFLSPNQSVCERHFESRYIKRYFEKNSNVLRSRLANDAVPTIFPDNSINYVSNYEVSTTLLDNSNSRSNYQIQPTNREASLQDIVKDLSASEQLLLNIKQEMFQQSEEEISKIKYENIEDYSDKVKAEIKDLSVYEELERNLNHYAKLLPESWSISRFPIGNDEVFAFSKECTVSENEALLFMYEKNIVLNRSGNMHYSIHGKTLDNSHSCTPDVLNDVGLLLDIISKFNEVKVCQGIYSNEYEVDKDCIVYKDDLGYCRHIDCILITDKEQCNACYEYSQYLYNIMVHNPVFHNGPLYYHDQVY